MPLLTSYFRYHNNTYPAACAFLILPNTPPVRMRIGGDGRATERWPGWLLTKTNMQVSPKENHPAVSRVLGIGCPSYAQAHMRGNYLNRLRKRTGGVYIKKKRKRT